MARKGKKKTELPAWHANFRNAEELPDIKPIRTDFLFNFVSLALMVGLLCYVTFTEYQAMQLRSSIGQLEKRIQGATYDNNQNLRLSAEFDRLSVQIKEAGEFTAMQVRPTQLLAGVVDSLPAEMLVVSIALADRTIQEGRRTRYAKSLTLSGTVAGADSLRSTQIVNDYLATFGALPGLAAQIERISLQSLQRDPRQGVFTFNILVELKAR